MASTFANPSSLRNQTKEPHKPSARIEAIIAKSNARTPREQKKDGA